MDAGRKRTVGIIFGGRSVEHEISLISARAVIANTDPERFDVLPIYIDKHGIWHRAGLDGFVEGGSPEYAGDAMLVPSLEPGKGVLYELHSGEPGETAHVDVFFPVLHGTYGEDGSIQGLFELMGVPYVGASVLGSALGMDKIAMKSLLIEADIPVLDYTWFNAAGWKADKEGIRGKVLEEVGLPCFVKSSNLGSSVGISRVESAQRLEAAIEHSLTYAHRVLVERGLTRPREIEVSVLGNWDPEASVPGEIIPHREFYDYTAKYIEEGTELVIPAPLPEEASRRLREYATRGFGVLECSGMARVDFLIDRDSGGIYFNELNTIPGFTRISMYPKLWEASGLGFKELVTRLIELALERHRAMTGLETSYGP